VQGRKPNLCPISNQKEDKREPQHSGFKLPLHGIQVCPQERSHSFTPKRLLGSKVEKDCAEQGLSNADAAQDEVFPCRFQAGPRAIKRYKQYCRKRGRLHRHPEQTHIVGQQRQQHGEHEELIHTVIKTETSGIQSSMILFNPHIGPREQCGCEADEGGQRNQEDIERIDEKLFISGQHGPVSNHPQDKKRRGNQRCQAHPGIEFGCEPACPE
jgi:hypothetical protein